MVDADAAAAATDDDDDDDDDDGGDDGDDGDEERYQTLPTPVFFESLLMTARPNALKHWKGQKTTIEQSCTINVGCGCGRYKSERDGYHQKEGNFHNWATKKTLLLSIILVV